MRPHFSRGDDGLVWEGAALHTVAREYGTPCFVYSRATVQSGWEALRAAFPHSRPTLCYAVKANGNLSLLKILAQLGAEFDIVSAGELTRVLAAGAAPSTVVFSGVGKSENEIAQAMAAGIGCFNAESAGELTRILRLAAERGLRAPVSIRVTPDINAQTHRHLTTGTAKGKFGLPPDEAMHLARFAAQSPQAEFLGLSCHLGSQITSPEVYIRAARQMVALVDTLAAEGVAARRINMGGGFAVEEAGGGLAIELSSYDAELARLFAGKELLLEPGRSIVAAAGVLLTRVEYVKESTAGVYWIVDAGMSELLRPMLYDAFHDAEPVRGGGELRRGHIAGPVCESADIMAKGRELAAAAGDVLAIFDVGAYGFVMASNYNARPRPCEVLIDGDRHKLIRRREMMSDLLAPEQFAPGD